MAREEYSAGMQDRTLWINAKFENRVAAFEFAHILNKTEPANQLKSSIRPPPHPIKSREIFLLKFRNYEFIKILLSPLVYY